MNTTAEKTSPFADNRITKYIAKQMEALAGQKTQREIAREVGFSTPNMVTMMKTGDARVPLDRVAKLAKALGVDQMFLMRLALEQYLDPTSLSQVETSLSQNEIAIIKHIREVSGETDPGLNDRRRAALAEAFGA